VAEAICAFPGVKHANVYGVTIPGTEGRAGMALLVAEPGLDLQALRCHLRIRLPSYARPLFLRLAKQVELTGSFRHRKTDLVREGYDFFAIADALYFDHPELQAFVPLDRETYDRLQAREIRL
jgi:fatty-acyl-CoA synthase